MRIGVVGPFNPNFVKDYLYDGQEIPDYSHDSTSVNVYVRGLLDAGNNVIVFTKYTQYSCLKGDRLRIYLIPDYERLAKNRYVNFLLRRGKLFFKGPSFSEFSNCFIKEIAKEINNLDILHAEWTYEYALAVNFFENKLPTFCSVRDWCPYLLNLLTDKEQKKYWKRKYKIFKKVMASQKTTFIANSDYTYKCIKEMYSTKNVVIIPNPFLSSNILSERKKYPKEFTFISISNSLKNIRKNILTLLKAFRAFRKKHNDARMVLIGNYSEDWKEERTSEGLLEGVTLKGFLNHDEIFKTIDESSCLIHPSLEETFGNIFLEGMCRRVPCIGGENAGAVPQILGYGKYGILCDVTKAESIIEAMEKILDRDLFMQLVNDSTKYILETYTEKIVVQKHLELFSEALNKNR